MDRSRLFESAIESTYVKPNAPVNVRQDLVECDHTVQFYEDDRCLVDSLAEFFQSALDSGGSAVVIATEEHLDAL